MPDSTYSPSSLSRTHEAGRPATSPSAGRAAARGGKAPALPLSRRGAHASLTPTVFLCPCHLSGAPGMLSFPVFPARRPEARPMLEM